MFARLFAILVSLTIGLAAQAAVPSAFSVQGVLRDGAGKLQSMPLNVTVALYDAQTMGNKLAGPYGPQPIMASNGLFTYQITDAALQASLGSAAEVWLDITVGNDTFPRQPVSPQMFALMCGTADTAKSFSGATLQVGQSALVVPDFHNGKGAALKFNTVELVPNMDTAILSGNRAGVLQIGNNGFQFLNTSATQTAGAAITDLKEVMTITTDGSVGIGVPTPGPYGVLEGAKSGYAAFDVRSTDANGVNVVLAANASSQARLNVLSNHPLLFFTNDTERMRLDAGGNVGIGTTTPSAQLEVTLPVAANTTAGLRVNNRDTIDQTYNIISSVGRSGSKAFAVFNGGADVMRIYGSGDIQTNGSITAGTGGCACSSDARLKTNVKTIEGALDAVGRLRGVTFDWKKDGKHSLGVIAQEVAKVYPVLVSTAPDGTKAVDYGKLAGVFIESTKELRAENAALRGRLDAIEARLQRRAAR